MKLNFRSDHDQKFFCDWRKRERTLRFCGRCCVCGKRTYGFTDGENDPRGPLGIYAASSFSAADYSMQGPDVPMCFNCANDQDRYNRGLEKAKRLWK